MEKYVKLAERAAASFVILSKMRALALKTWSEMDETVVDGPPAVRDALRAHYDHLRSVFPEIGNVGDLGRHIRFNCRSDYWDIVDRDIPIIEREIQKILSTPPECDQRRLGFEDLLHPKIRDTALPLYGNGHMQQSVATAYAEVFIEIRRRTGRTDDGAKLVNEVLRPDNPLLVISDLKTESGQNSQKGFMELLRGTYQAFRNVLAHPDPELNVSANSAARHLIFASILMEAIVDAEMPTNSVA